MANAEPKLGKSSKGTPMHYSAGAVIKRDGKYLLIDRVKIPLGFAGVSGHVDEGEDPEISLRREVKEESGLRVISEKLLYEGEFLDDECSKGIKSHYWYLYEVEVEGDIVWNKEETKSIDWYNKEEMKELKFEPMWDYWFKKLEILK